MAVSQTGTVGTVVPPGVRPGAAEVLKLRSELDLLHAQLMSRVRPTPQRMVSLLNAYMDAVRRLHGNVAPLKMDLVTKSGDGKSASAPPDVCITPAPPAPPIPIPYPIVAASPAAGSAATKTVPGTEAAQRSSLEASHLQIKSGTNTAPEQMRGVVSKHIQGVCTWVCGGLDVKIEGPAVVRLGDPLFHNKRNIQP